MAGLLSADPVSIELRRWSSEPFIWGETDCGVSIVAYAERISGKVYDGASHDYRNAAEACEFLHQQGGYEAYCCRVMSALGWTRTSQAMRGDVGLVILGMGIGLTACLCVDRDRWAAHGDRETIIITRTAQAAWRAPCLKPFSQ